MAAEMRARRRELVELALLVAVSRDLVHALADDGAFAGLQLVTEPTSPGATYSQKFLTAVMFSLTKLSAPLAGLRLGS